MGKHRKNSRFSMLRAFTSLPVEDRLKRFHGEEWHSRKGRLIRDIVYAVDTGLITMIAFMAGISVSIPNPHQIILAGVTHAISGMLAIFFSSYISTKTQCDFFESQIERERQELYDMPVRERAEVHEILMDMGFTKEEADMGTHRITSNHETWLKFMVQEEIGLVPGTADNPMEIGLVSTGSFLLGVVPPFLPFAFGLPVQKALPISCVLVVLFLFLMGIAKTRLTKLHWLKSGLETMAVGAMSCGIGYILGHAAALITMSK